MEVMSPEWWEQKEQQRKKEKQMKQTWGIIKSVWYILLHTALGFVTGIALLLALTVAEMWLRIDIPNVAGRLLLLACVVLGAIWGYKYAKLSRSLD